MKRSVNSILKRFNKMIADLEGRESEMYAVVEAKHREIESAKAKQAEARSEATKASRVKNKLLDIVE